MQEKEHIIEQKNIHKDITHMHMNLEEKINQLIASQQNDLDINYNEIIEIYEEKDHNEQEFRLITWLNKNKGHKEGVILKAYIAYDREEWSLAYKLYKYVVDIYSEEFEFNNTLGLIYEKLGDYKKAEEKYILLLNHDYNNLFGLFNLGNLYYKVYSNVKKALYYLLRAKDIEPEDSEILNNIGVIYKELGDYELAKEYFELGMKYSSNNPLPFLNMGELYMDVLNKYDDAIICFKQYLKFPAKQKDKIYNVLGLIYGSVVYKDRDKAIDYFNEALKINPYLKEAKINLEIIKGSDLYFDNLLTFSGDREIDLLKQGYVQ
ncbi:hypothetical protein A500_17320 [Clostridium sartagoforme AAU1]|uniref:Uncharacterized protein n=1 Tax=Clostridium sartagoforme AAU1 TaxID=1202534 RepID=R9BTU0_9CLOT|nr:tetratricopeptide repeat protein [Clostridium sartagoforme]EOR20417.1 hypothetical protein A500_17320 [Clostridium sartagoforme AAU1]